MPLGTASYEILGGKALVGLGGFTAYQTHSNSECLKSMYGSETMSDKVRSRKGNSPDRQLRSPNTA